MTKHAPATPMRNLDRIRELHALPHLDVAQRLEHCERDRAQLVDALRELHAIDERKLAATEKRPYAIGVSVIRGRVELNRALLRSLGED